ncbi:MAG TPA: AbrB/MazE/SpoVT family DNA-binding domain-containing protein [Candidatus Acidoferrales bacterium]|nr:AbrB/MazE/SpoVT family DNA-binding domain-containing protein [Candidatus Acidoferrales bacterium]
MSRVTISPKFQIVIPREIRERLGLRPGQQITLFERDGIITAVPDLPLEKFRGILKGMSRTELREKQERI